MNDPSLLNKLIRRTMLGILLFPGTFVWYKTKKDWFAAISNGNGFLYPIRDNINEIITYERKNKIIHRLFIAIPLRIARKILFFGCKRAFLFFLGRKEKFKRISPTVIDLVPGLLENNDEARSRVLNMLRSLSKEKISISGNVHYLFGEERSFVDQRTVLIAHWDPEHIVDPYVIYQCRHFKSLGFKVVLTSSQKPYRFDTDTCSEWLDAFIYRTCDGYDFTSWKAAFDICPSLYSCHEVILTNDSYFSPIGSFAPIHKEMDRLECDFWGLVHCNLIRPHLQSYYLVLRKSVLCHDAFRTFLSWVSLSNDRDNAISYETSFSLWLSLHNLKPAAFVPIPENSLLNYTFEYWNNLISEGVPILKREFFLKKEYNAKIENWKSICMNKGYPVELICKYIKRVTENPSQE